MSSEPSSAELMKLILELQSQILEMKQELSKKPSIGMSITDKVSAYEQQNQELSNDVEQKIEKTIDLILKAYGPQA